MARFRDTNILIRYLTNDDPNKASLALALLDRVAEGAEQVATTPLVIFETIFLLQRTYKLANDRTDTYDRGHPRGADAGDQPPPDDRDHRRRVFAGRKPAGARIGNKQEHISCVRINGLRCASICCAHCAIDPNDLWCGSPKGSRAETLASLLLL